MTTRRESCRTVGWGEPVDAWFKLNTDGAAKGNPEFAGAGGIICDAMGRWFGGLFIQNVGISTTIGAEIWAVKSGLELALGIPQLMVKMDSDVIVSTITSGRDQLG